MAGFGLSLLLLLLWLGGRKAAISAWPCWPVAPVMRMVRGLGFVSGMVGIVLACGNGVECGWFDFI